MFEKYWVVENSSPRLMALIRGAVKALPKLNFRTLFIQADLELKSSLVHKFSKFLSLGHENGSFFFKILKLDFLFSAIEIQPFITLVMYRAKLPFNISFKRISKIENELIDIFIPVFHSNIELSYNDNLDAKVLKTKKQVLIGMPGSEIKTFKPARELNEYIVIIISKQYLRKILTPNLFDTINYKNGASYTLKNDRKIIEISEKILYTSKSNLSPFKLNSLVFEILSEVFEASQNSGREPPSIGENLGNYICDNIEATLNLDELANQYNLSKVTLQKEFRKHHHLSIYQFYNLQRIEFSKKLLLDQVSLNLISERLGYSSSSHFIASFKKELGLTPSVWLKQQTSTFE